MKNNTTSSSISKLHHSETLFKKLLISLLFPFISFCILFCIFLRSGGGGAGLAALTGVGEALTGVGGDGFANVGYNEKKKGKRKI